MSSFRTLTHQGIRPIVLPDEAEVEVVSTDINWADAGAGIAIGDVVQSVDIPQGVEVVDWVFVSDDIDSNGAPTVAFTLGVLNAGKTAIGAGATDAWTAAGAITAPQTAGRNAPAGATGANHYLGGRAAKRTIGLVATAATATAALTGKRATLILYLRAGVY
jgi:hypothetical protein